MTARCLRTCWTPFRRLAESPAARKDGPTSAMPTRDMTTRVAVKLAANGESSRVLRARASRARKSSVVIDGLSNGPSHGSIASGVSPYDMSAALTSTMHSQPCMFVDMSTSFVSEVLKGVLNRRPGGSRRRFPPRRPSWRCVTPGPSSTISAPAAAPPGTNVPLWPAPSWWR